MTQFGSYEQSLEILRAKMSDKLRIGDQEGAWVIAQCIAAIRDAQDTERILMEEAIEKLSA